MKLETFTFKKVNSTNTTAIRLLNQKKKSGIVVSERQAKGRGKGRNNWISIYRNLFLSIFFPINNKLSIKNITRINLNIVKDVIKKNIDQKIHIKYPNDILINNSKVCGILQEVVFKNNIKYIIIGIGINVFKSPNIHNYKTSHLNYYSKKKINKIKIFEDIKKKFEDNIKKYK